MTQELTFVSPAQEWWLHRVRLLRAMGYTPSALEDEVLRCQNRIILLSGGEQAGKSITAAMYLLTRMPQGKLYWMVGADYEQNRKEFTYALDGLARVGAVQERDISMPIRGAWSFRAFDRKISVVTKSAADVTKLGREGPDGILLNEAAQVDYQVYLRCLGRTAPKHGWLFMSGTLESATDWYSDALKRWQAPNAEGAQAFIMPSWSNPILYPLGEDDPEIQRLKALLPEDQFLMRFGAVARPPENLVMPEFQYSTHIREDVKFNPELPVQLWIDPGYSGSMYSVEVVQLVGADEHSTLAHPHVIDEVYKRGALTGMIIEECRGTEWWDNKDLVVIDLAGTQHHAAPSHAEIWANEGVGVVWQKVPVEDGIVCHRSFLKDPGTGQPRIFFSENCTGATKEYGKWLRVNGKPQIINCDALKAISYGLVHNYGYVEYTGEPSKVESPWSF